MSDPFIAEIRIFAGNFAPRSWSFCNGALLPISQNTALFSILGTTYGGDGRTTLALPNLEDRAVMHPGNGPGLTPRRLGERGGAASVLLDDRHVPNHTHNLVAHGDPGNTDESIPASDRSLAAVPGSAAGFFPDQYGPPTSLVTTAQITDEQGGTQAHNNVQPFLSLNFIIALQGTFPPRN